MSVCVCFDVPFVVVMFVISGKCAKISGLRSDQFCPSVCPSVGWSGYVCESWPCLWVSASLKFYEKIVTNQNKILFLIKQKILWPNEKKFCENRKISATRVGRPSRRWGDKIWWQNSKTQIVTKLNTEIATKLENSNWDQTQFFFNVTKLETQIVTK